MSKTRPIDLPLHQLLRHPATVFYEYAADDGALLKRAADEIDALRAALHEIAETEVGSHTPEIARKALGGDS